MDTDLKLGFDWLECNRLCTTVKVFKNGHVEVVNYTDAVIDTVFGIKKNVSELDVLDFLEYRCFPRTRANASELLADIGLRGYNPVEITKITHGQLCDDKFWIRYFNESHLKYEDIRYDYNFSSEVRGV